MAGSITLTALLIHCLFGLGIYGLARFEYNRVSKKSERKSIHGRYISEWVAIGYLLPGQFSFLQNWPDGPPKNGPEIYSSFGLLFGLFIGWVHGNIRLAKYRSVSVSDAVKLTAREPDDGNPYRPHSTR